MVDFWCRFFSRFGADFFTVYADFSLFIRGINGEKKISLLMIFFTVSFSRFTPSFIPYWKLDFSFILTLEIDFCSILGPSGCSIAFGLMGHALPECLSQTSIRCMPALLLNLWSWCPPRTPPNTEKLKAWWAFRPRKKYLAPPPHHRHSPGALPPPAPPPWKPPPPPSIFYKKPAPWHKLWKFVKSWGGQGRLGRPLRRNVSRTFVA